MMMHGEAHTKAKLTDALVTQMRRQVHDGEAKLADLARAHGVSAVSARRAVIGESWKHLTEPPVIDHRPRTMANASCFRGHEYTDANTRRRPDGSRICRTCLNATTQARRDAKRASTPGA